MIAPFRLFRGCRFAWPLRYSQERLRCAGCGPDHRFTPHPNQSQNRKDAERQCLTCDATCEVWFERDGQPIGSGRTTRTISRRLRRALEHRHPTCVVPGCAATRGLHAHHVRHWEDGGDTELDNLILLCPHHHRLRTGYPPEGHRQRRQPTPPRVTGPTTQPTPAHRGTLPRADRRTCPVVVVRPVPAETTAGRQLICPAACGAPAE